LRLRSSLGGRNGFLLSLSGSWATSPCCQSRQTSLWSGVTREPGKQASGGDADMSAAATLAGAVPGHGNMSCLPQVSIVKVSSGKSRRAESARFDRVVGAILVRRESITPPTADREAAAHQRRTGSDNLPRGGGWVTLTAVSRDGVSHSGGNRVLGRA
jgi:hypothetical protein